MRLARLDLIRFGHFTDRTLELPKGELDLHLIVGGNEAGKSTLRQAILNLLYGFPIRAEYDFKHALATLRLGARLEDGDAPLEILRVNRALRAQQREQQEQRSAHGAWHPEKIDTSLRPP